MITCNECETVAHCLKHGCIPKRASMRDAIEMARESHLDVYGLGKSHAKFVEALEHFAAIARAAEREAFAAKIQAEIDHAYLNELRLVPSFGKRQGDIAVRATHLEAALDAIRARGRA
jgi:pyruvate/2-oxoglutarate dehydrogenase complex dihydrolipoamide dehydrogenase (E3) component